MLTNNVADGIVKKSANCHCEEPGGRRGNPLTSTKRRVGGLPRSFQSLAMTYLLYRKLWATTLYYLDRGAS